jgi:hypothetical protein
MESSCAGRHRSHDVHRENLGVKCGESHNEDSAADRISFDKACHNPKSWNVWRFKHDLRTQMPSRGRMRTSNVRRVTAVRGLVEYFWPRSMPIAISAMTRIAGDSDEIARTATHRQSEASFTLPESRRKKRKMRNSNLRFGGLRFGAFVRQIATSLVFITAMLIASGSYAQSIRPTFDHDLTRFPLTGRHDTTNCETCHVGGQFAGTPANCSDCHAGGSGRAETRPSVRHIPIQTTCNDCHSTRFWEPAVMDHGSVGTNCDSCHVGRSRHRSR